MSDQVEHVFAISYSENETFVASSAIAPYFCFEAETEEEVEAIARRALDFHHGLEGKLVPHEPANNGIKLVRSRSRGSKTSVRTVVTV